MVVSPWHDVYVARIANKNRKMLARNKVYRPRVSVLVPAWNEEDGILLTLKSLLNSTYRNLEVIVIDNASTDNTKINVRRLIRNYRTDETDKREKIRIICIEERTQGKGHALNKGITSAKGDIIISIDADCFVPPETVKNFVKHFEIPSVMAAVGNVKIGNTNSIIEVVQYLEFLFSFYFKKCDSIMNSIYIIGGAAGAFRKEVFQKVGGYNPDNITEDIELSFRIQYAGLKIVYAEDAIVYTEGAADFKGLIKQRLRWKRGRLETFINYRKMFFSGKRIHKKILSWLILPLAVFGDLQLFLELFFLIFVYIYSYLTNDYSSFISGIVVVNSMFVIQIFFDIRNKKNINLLLLAPIGWLLFYASTFVEFSALIKTILGYLRKEQVQWQRWNRKGVFSQSVKEEIISTKNH